MVSAGIVDPDHSVADGQDIDRCPDFVFRRSLNGQRNPSFGLPRNECCGHEPFDSVLVQSSRGNIDQELELHNAGESRAAIYYANRNLVGGKNPYPYRGR